MWVMQELQYSWLENRRVTEQKLSDGMGRRGEEL